ncbi:MAG: cation:proton antiporter [Tissierellia bacterium]|nr:cation:proton antiporter [Tissierellia bacterium]
MEALYYMAIILIAGLLFAKIFGMIKLPDVTGYLLAGIIIGPSVLKLIPMDSVKNLEIISQVALAIIAFTTGIELKFDKLKTAGKSIMIITFAEVFGAFLFVAIPMVLIFKQSIAFSIVLGAIATATAPASTIMVIRQYKASGPLVDTLIPVVAIDDGLCIMMFGICSTIAKTLISNAELSIFSMLIKPLGEIAGAILLGLVFGIIAIKVLKILKHSANLTSFILAMIFLQTFIAIKFEISSLLVMLSFGATITNLSTYQHRAISAVDGITGPIFMSFFVISGADLDLSVVASVGLIGAAYILTRIAGKVIGSYYSAKFCKLDKNVYNYLGFTLLPQAGVAIGLAMLASNIIPPPFGAQIRTIILAATVFYEITGPMLTKYSLERAGEITK